MLKLKEGLFQRAFVQTVVVDEKVVRTFDIN